MAGEIKTLEFSEGVSVSTPFDAGSGSGTGEVNFVENNNGTSDLDQSQTDAVGDWIDSGTGTTSSITTTDAEIPRFPFQTTAIKITNDGSGTAYTAIRFRVPPADRSKKLKIEWAQKPDGSIYETGDLDIELYNYSDAYSTGETQVSIVGNDNGIPNQTGVTYYEFDSDDREYYELRFVRSAGSASGFIAINDFVVGPGKLHSGAVVSSWESFTPTGTWSTNTAMVGHKRRVGDSLELQIRVTTSGAPDTAALQLDIPDSLTANTALVDSSIAQVGAGFVYDFNASAGRHACMVNVVSNKLRLIADENTAVGESSPFTWAANDSALFWATIPIEEWARSGVLNTITQDNLSEWVEFTPDISGFGTITSPGTIWHRNGPNLKAIGRFTTGTTAATTANLSLPNSYTILDVLPANTVVGQWWINSVAGTTRKRGTLYTNTSGDTIRFGSDDYTAGVSPGASLDGDEVAGSSTIVWIELDVPVQEFAGSQSSLVGFSRASSSQSGLVSNQSDGSFTATFTQTSGYSEAVTVNWARVGDLVTLEIPNFEGSATDAETIAASAAVPSDIRPSATITQLCSVRDGGTVQADPGMLFVSTNGTITLWSGIDTAVFSSSGNAGLRHIFSITYRVN